MVMIIGLCGVFGGLICEGTQDRSYALCHAFILTIMVVCCLYARLKIGFNGLAQFNDLCLELGK